MHPLNYWQYAEQPLKSSSLYEVRKAPNIPDWRIRSVHAGWQTWRALTQRLICGLLGVNSLTQLGAREFTLMRDGLLGVEEVGRMQMFLGCKNTQARMTD